MELNTLKKITPLNSRRVQSQFKRFWIRRSSLASLILGCAAILLFPGADFTWAQAKGHAVVGLEHGEEGYLHLERMIQHLEFSVNVPDASPQLKKHGNIAARHAKEALKHYYEALRHTAESLGRPMSDFRAEGSGSENVQPPPPPEGVLKKGP